MPPPHYHLITRGANSNGTSNSNLSDGAIIIIVLVASGFAVLVGYSITRFYFDKDTPDRSRAVGDEQLQYMHSMRRRNLENLASGLGMKEGYRSSESQFSEMGVQSGERGGGV